MQAKNTLSPILANQRAAGHQFSIQSETLKASIGSLAFRRLASAPTVVDRWMDCIIDVNTSNSNEERIQ